MQTSLRAKFSVSLRQYQGSKRTDWIARWPGQVAVAGSQVMWTSEIEACLAGDEPTHQLEEYKAQLDDQLLEIANMLRSDSVSSLYRKMASALVTMRIAACAMTPPCSYHACVRPTPKSAIAPTRIGMTTELKV